MKKSQRLLYCFFAFTFCLFPYLLSAQCITGSCINGQGTFLYPSGAKYVGAFQNRRMHGQGVCQYSDKSKYEGMWKNGYPEGPGKKTLANGETWIGEWRKGQPYDKNGQLVDLDQMSTQAPADKRYAAPERLADKVGSGEGCISGNCYDGQGTYIYKGHSARYIGTFQNEMPAGYGKIIYANGDQYEGNWSNGSFQGQGTLSLNSGERIVGFWDNGIYAGRTNQQTTSNTNNYTTPTNNTAPSNGKPLNVWAVIVGVSTYNHMPTLKYTDDDASECMLL